MGTLNETLNRTGVLTIADDAFAPVPMATAAWCGLDYSQLWLPGPFRGANLTIPGSFGKRPKRVRIDETVVSLPWAFAGDRDQTGAFYGDEWQGLIANVEAFYNAVVVPPPLPATTRLASLVLLDGTTREGEVQILGLTSGTITGRSKPVMRATLEVRIPAGRLTPV